MCRFIQNLERLDKFFISKNIDKNRKIEHTVQ